SSFQLWAMRSSFLLLLTFLLGVTDIQAGSDFRVCAFNTQHFGESKSQKSDLILSCYGKCNYLHFSMYDTKHEYKAVASERLGRSETYQEQYVFVYRTDTVTVADQYQYPDDKPGDIDAFSREPFVVRFRAPKTAIKEFVLIPQHTTPANTTKELDALYDVLQHVKKMWKTEVKNVMLLGDFNAGCGYLAKKNRKRVRLITDQNLFWLIQENTDTTVRSSTSCSYDRIVVNGETFHRAILPSSAKPFNFQVEYRLTEEQVTVLCVYVSEPCCFHFIFNAESEKCRVLKDVGPIAEQTKCSNCWMLDVEQSCCSVCAD
uniref:Deoxyribonuclease-1-like 1 n=1 Tax=Amphilophus citrinellus TaxID=61819 RepID=A0A3Q0REA5_AMPCI